ncbi:MAG: hypothetical protein EKK46_00235 [Rhodocyclaceae bacterium]|nr:MAG: hypothetical protein EKK46_00235 [Rhodocyclaceae bacterium]
MRTRRLHLLLATAFAASACLSTLAHADSVDFRVNSGDFSIGVDIGTPPPPMRVEVVPPPRSGYVWVPGFWGWDGHRHVWQEGYWEHERPGYAYAPGRWERHGEQWHFEPGRWQAMRKEERREERHEQEYREHKEREHEEREHEHHERDRDDYRR